MTLTIDHAKKLVIEFCATYPVASTISYKIRETQEELYGPQATREAAGTILGSFHPRGRRAVFATANFSKDEEFTRSLRHEILGHFGINTFNPAEKRAVLNALIDARTEPSTAALWTKVDQLYPGISDLRKAEEVFAFACEEIDPDAHANTLEGARSFRETCIDRSRPMQISDLINLTSMVAEGLHDRSRSQQNFPASDNAQFKIETAPRTSEYPVWLAVPPDDRDKARLSAGRLSDGRAAIAWNKEEKLWFARPGCDLDRITDWLPDPSRRAGGGDAESEFLDVLTQAGLVVKGMPVMNGSRQRVATVDDKHGKKSGVYCGFLDRRPAGWFINYHRADSAKDVTNWAATGGESDPITRLHIRAGAKQAQEDAARDRAVTYAKQTLAAKRLYDLLPAADPAHPYLVRKGIPPTPDIRQTRNGALVVPFFNASGTFKTLQYIPPEGEKFLFKDAPKQGHFLVVGGPLDPVNPILYAEGYATARSLNLATGLPVVMTIDAGNMVAVAKVLRQQYPDNRHVFMADFDHAKKVNKGLIMANEAAIAVGGQVMYPTFNDAEIAREFSDFNDLHQSRGLDAVREQTAPLIRQYEEVTAMPTDSNTQAQDVAPAMPIPDEAVQSQADLVQSGDPTSTAESEDKQAKTFILMDADNGMVWDGQAFKAADLAEAERFTPIDGLKAALELEHSQRYALEGAAIEIHRYMPVLDESVRVITTNAAKTWPELKSAFKKAGLEVSQETYQSIRDEVAARLDQSSTLPVEPVTEVPLVVGTADVPVQQPAAVIEPEKTPPTALPEALPVDGPQPASAPLTEMSDEAAQPASASVEAAPPVKQQTSAEADPDASAIVDDQPKATMPAATDQEMSSDAPLLNQPPLAAAEPEQSNETAQPAAPPTKRQASVEADPDASPVAEDQPITAPAGPAQNESNESLSDVEVPVSGALPRRFTSARKTGPAVVPDAIFVGAPIGADEPQPQASNIDKDALLARISREVQGDNSVLYKLDAEPAFVDRGSRLEMAQGAGQEDEKVIAALLTAAQFYRGRIELTGSDEFKAKAIELIAQHQINVEMKNPAQQMLLDDARNALKQPPVTLDAIHGDTPPPYGGPQPSQAKPSAPQPQQAAPAPVHSSAPAPASTAYQPLEVEGLQRRPAQPAPKAQAPQAGVAPQPQQAAPAPGHSSAPAPASTAYQPLEVEGLQRPLVQPAPPAQPDAPVINPPSAAPASDQPATSANQQVSPAIHQPFQAAKDGVTGKILKCGQKPFRFEPDKPESTFITLRTKNGVQTFWGKELAGLLRQTRVQPGKMVTLQWLGNFPVTVKVPRKNEQGVTVGYDDKDVHRNQWALKVEGNPAVRSGQDEGVKLGAYDAGRFAVVQQAWLAQLGVEVPLPTPPTDGLYWLTPNGEGSAKTGDELSAPRPPIDPNNTAGQPVISSWSQDGNLNMYLVRGDGPYLQGVVRQGDQMQHVLVSLPGRDDGPSMVFNAITPEGLLPIGTGNGINRSGGEPVSREHIAFKLEGDSAVRIGKLDAPGEVPPTLHALLGFDQRWKEENTLPKSAPTAAPSVQPSDPRPV
ncbi:DNA primase [Pseudomonas syringae pv. theae]|uniref:DNA primase n=3 Tax=Pseudomonas syringae group TaxID=136849 RepID=A0A9P3AGY8_PSEA0|nr:MULTISPECIES: LPD7 domain-containing protein [Pseudomonas syringae group]MBL3838029.1 DNA primase [Pseudomonas syringae pv. theae]MBL3869999.1 DNA primase [Pseudomonas syringae pv. theae]GFZ61540.1 DNA primase [Pseudomonas amygdali pv. eriobotryae]GKQ48716.1 DNA primase [Pseudomonas syringae pv. theae]GKS05535.1 DNA primase [Pseudomonas syringae pv. theae]